MDVIGAIKAAYDGVKAIQALDDKVKAAQFNVQLADLLNLLADAQMKAFDLTREVISLREQLDAERAYKAATVTRDASGLLMIDGDGPFCPKCWSTKMKSAVVASHIHAKTVMSRNHECTVCKSLFT